MKAGQRVAGRREAYREGRDREWESPHRKIAGSSTQERQVAEAGGP